MSRTQALRLLFFCFVALSAQGLLAQQQAVEGSIALPVYDAQGKVASVSGFVFDDAGGRPSFHLGLGPEAFGIRVSGTKGPSKPAPLINLLNHPSIHKELELTKQQDAQINRIRKEGRAKIAEQLNNIPLGQRTTDRNEAVHEVLNGISDDQEERLVDTLLPQQVQRLKEISFQAWEKECGVISILQSPKMRESLAVDSDQMTELKNASKEIEERLAEDIAKLKEKARRDLLGKLSAEQRSKYNRLHGEPFRATPSDWRNWKQ